MPEPIENDEILVELCDRERELRAKAAMLPAGEQRATIVLLADAYARQIERMRGHSAAG